MKCTRLRCPRSAGFRGPSNFCISLGSREIPRGSLSIWFTAIVITKAKYPQNGRSLLAFQLGLTEVNEHDDKMLDYGLERCQFQTTFFRFFCSVCDCSRWCCGQCCLLLLFGGLCCWTNRKWNLSLLIVPKTARASEEMFRTDFAKCTPRQACPFRSVVTWLLAGLSRRQCLYRSGATWNRSKYLLDQPATFGTIAIKNGIFLKTDAVIDGVK